MSEKSRPYRPSNGTEGDIFLARFCENCTRDTEESPCLILGLALGYSIDAPEYPKEWVQDGHGPRCTSFTTLPAEEIYRCPNTADLFKGD